MKEAKNKIVFYNKINGKTISEIRAFLVFGENLIDFTDVRNIGRDGGVFYVDKKDPNTQEIKREILGRGWTHPKDYKLIGKRTQHKNEQFLYDLVQANPQLKVYRFEVKFKNSLCAPFHTPGRWYQKYIILEPIESYINELLEGLNDKEHTD